MGRIMSVQQIKWVLLVIGLSSSPLMAVNPNGMGEDESHAGSLAGAPGFPGPSDGTEEEVNLKEETINYLQRRLSERGKNESLVRSYIKDQVTALEALLDFI